MLKMFATVLNANMNTSTEIFVTFHDIVNYLDEIASVKIHFNSSVSAGLEITIFEINLEKLIKTPKRNYTINSNPLRRIELNITNDVHADSYSRK